MSILDNLPHECSILKRKYTKGSLGGKKWVYETVSTGVECWEQQTGSSDLVMYQKKGLTATRKIYFTSDPGVTARHRIVMTKRNGAAVASADQIELEVVGAPIPDSSVGKEILWKVLVKELTGEDE